MSSLFALQQAARSLVADEQGTLFKEAHHRVALVYPSPYRAAMSSLGYQLIYRTIHAMPDWTAERAMLPDDLAAWKKSRVPLFTLESMNPVADFDVVAFSLAYELEITGVFECLELSGMPIRACDRDESHPLVIIGGPLTFSNPVPAGPFADIIIMGEGEELIPKVLDAIASGIARHEVLSFCASVPGFYVPAIHGEKLLPVVAADNSMLPAHGQIVTPNTELADMHLVESERGCHRKCTFCVMRRSTNGGMRLASPQAILDTIPDYAPRVGLVGAAVSDHPKLVEIVEAIVAKGKGVGVSSLRADRMTPELVELLQRAGYRTLTVASDGASERIRQELQKVIREEHLLYTAQLAQQFNMRIYKMYMMIGVPGETEEDIDELIAFSREVGKVVPTALGIAPFVAKRNTPLDRQPFAGIKIVEQRLERLRKELRGVVDIRATSARWAWVEWAMAQGGFDMADAAEEAWRAGGGFSAWKRAIRDHRRDEQMPASELRLGRPMGRFTDEVPL